MYNLKMNRFFALSFLTFWLLAAVPRSWTCGAFVLNSPQTNTRSLTIVAQASLASRQYTRRDRNSNNGRDGPPRTKRQERVGHLVQTELSKIVHQGVLRGDSEYLEADLRQRISVVNADVSPDLKQARISISVRGPNKKAKEPQNEDEEEDFAANYNPIVDKRRAYAWLVRNTKPIRHSLAQRMSHMKSCPDLTFVQVDVAAAVDVMYLIDKVAAGYKREKIGELGENDMPTGILGDLDFGEEFDEDDWDEEEFPV